MQLLETKQAYWLLDFHQCVATSERGVARGSDLNKLMTCEQNNYKH